MLSFSPRDVLNEIFDLIKSVSGGGGGGVPTYSFKQVWNGFILKHHKILLMLPGADLTTKVMH